MTQEQWLVYAYSVWPNGEWTSIWGTLVIVGLVISVNLTYVYVDTNGKVVKKDTVKTFWISTGIVIFLLQVSFLIPDKKGMAAIIATPYIVEGGKSLVDSLKDPNSKAYKINQLIDKSLDKAVEEITKVSK